MVPGVLSTDRHEQSFARSLRAGLLQSRFILLAGFGGLLLLMAFAGVDSVVTIRQIQNSNDANREEFLWRTRLLEKIRSDVYLSGTYVRDYLLEPEPHKAESHRVSLLERRADIDRALAKYRGMLQPDETAPLQRLTGELSAYWKVLEPVFRWNAAERHELGYGFLRDEVFPRRMAMLGIADQIAAISESELNAGKMRVATTFSDFRRRLIVTIGLTIGLGLLLAGFTMIKILRLETETAGRYQEIAVARAELKQLSARLVEAQEEERRSISRELHDEVGQSLTGVLVEMANLSHRIRAGDLAAVEAKANELKKLVEDAVGVVRNMALLLRPSMLDDLGLVPALQWQAREVSKRTGVRVRVAAEGVSEDLPEEHKTCIYRIVQEALHNCVQHAGAHIVKVTVRQEADRILLEIHDDGKGFNAREERGMGLLGIQERVSYLGGTFLVESSPGKGALLSVALPVRPVVAHPMQTIS
jgi:signal transduction histidine kinase